MFQNFDPQDVLRHDLRQRRIVERGRVGPVNLTGSNTFTGSTNLYNGNLKLSGPNGAIAGTAPSTSTAAVWELVNATTQTGVNRVNDAAPVNAGGGMLKMTNAVGAVSYSQTMGQLTTNNGINVNSSVTNIGFTNDMTAAGGTQMLTFQRFTQNGQSTVNFYSPAGLDETNNIIQITGVAADVVMGPWATTWHGHQQSHGLRIRQHQPKHHSRQHPPFGPIQLDLSEPGVHPRRLRQLDQPAGDRLPDNRLGHAQPTERAIR